MNIIVKMHDRVRVIETTRMDLHSGIMLEDDFLDISDYLNQGVLLERSVFITTSDDMQLLKRAVTIIEPDELEAVEGVYADGKPILVRTEAVSYTHLSAETAPCIPTPAGDAAHA